jgi:hypothetical protein
MAEHSAVAKQLPHTIGWAQTLVSGHPGFHTSRLWRHRAILTVQDDGVAR